MLRILTAFAIALTLMVVQALPPVGAQTLPCDIGVREDGLLVCRPVNAPPPAATPLPSSTPGSNATAAPTTAPPPPTSTPIPVPTATALPPTPEPPPPPPPAAEPQLPDLPGLVEMVQRMENANWNVNDAVRYFQNQLNEAIGRGSSSDRDTFNAAMAINWLYPDEWRNAPFGRSTIGAIRGELCINGLEQIPDCPHGAIEEEEWWAVNLIQGPARIGD